jgi:hypothetical protein
MVDERTFKKYFQSVTPWRQYLTGEGFRSIENVRSPGQTTLTTFHKILSMSETASKSTSFFTTDFEAFRHTSAKGYRTQFLFHNNHFGRGRSPHWDYNYPSTSVGVCPWVPANFGLYLCHRAIETSVEHWLGVEDGLSNYRQQLISRIRSAASDRNGWLTVAHTWLPGHTSMDYRHGDDEVRATFRAEYVSKSIEAVGYMTDFVRTIRALDRDAVIVMFGDHGAILSRSWENESGVRSLFTESEMLSDRRDVSLYVYPTDFCRGRIQNGYPMHNVIADVFSCIEDLDMSERPGVTGWSGTSGLSTLRPRAPTGH